VFFIFHKNIFEIFLNFNTKQKQQQQPKTITKYKTIRMFVRERIESISFCSRIVLDHLQYQGSFESKGIREDQEITNILNE
jgi:hypothetical protein